MLSIQVKHMNPEPFLKEECIDRLLLLREWQFAALERAANRERQTVGQFIRRLIGLHLAGKRNRYNSEFGLREFQIEPLRGRSDIVEVTFLLPATQYEQIRFLTSGDDIAMGEFIHQIINCWLRIPELMTSTSRP